MQKKAFMTGLLFLVPISLFLIVFLLLPIVQTVYYSLTDWDGGSHYRYIGLRNYAELFQDVLFMDAFRRTLFIGLSITLLANVFGLIIAVLLDQSLKTKNTLRSLIYIPNVLPVVVAAFVWRYILDANSGMLNTLLSRAAGHKVTLLWIDSPEFVVYSIIVISVWQMLGPIMIVYLAALQSVPQEIREAARMDGITGVREFFVITLPMISSGITVSLLIGLANGIRIFDLPYALTGGGPANASETLAIKIYNYAFGSGQLAYGMAASFLMTIVVLLITYVFVGVSRKYESAVQG